MVEGSSTQDATWSLIQDHTGCCIWKKSCAKNIAVEWETLSDETDNTNTSQLENTDRENSRDTRFHFLANLEFKFHLLTN